MAKKKRFVTGGQLKKLEAREAYANFFARLGDLARAGQAWQAKGEVDRIKNVSDQLQLIISPEPRWLQDILALEQASWATFLGRPVELEKFRQDLLNYGEEKVSFWQSLGLEPHRLFKLSFTSDDQYPGWKVKPETWFYQQIKTGKIFRDIGGKLVKVKTVETEGITVLIDTRLKPAYDNGKQMWEDDSLLGEIIGKLRGARKIVEYEHGPQTSRFGVSADEWQRYVRPALVERFGLKKDQVRLETAIEMNVIPQLYPHMPRAKDGQTNTWVWLEEFFGGRAHRLHGGFSDDGGLADVDCSSSGNRWDGSSVRPLAVL